LLFGGFCLFWLGACAFIPAGFGFATLWFPGLPLQTCSIIAYSCVAASFLCLTLFCQAMFPNRLLRAVNRGYIPFTGGILGAMILGPYTWLYPALGLLILVDFGIVATLTYSLVLAIRHRSPGATSFAIGFGLFMGIAIHDALLFFGLIEGPYVIQLGGTALAVAEAFVLSRRLTSAHRSNLALLTEVRAKNEELGRLSRLKDDFLANTSHELRTPLHGISGLVQAVLADGSIALGGRTRRNLEHVVASARRLTRLINDILDFSRIRHKDIVLRRGPVELPGLLASLEPDFETSLRTKGLQWVVDCDPGLPPVDADEDRLVQILSNLVGNAVRFTDRGFIQVEARAVGNLVELSVHDTGVGIPPDQLARIFEPFEQVQGEYRGGTGLGLAITRRLVELHGGVLSVASDPGRGSTFRFRLPAAQPTWDIRPGVADTFPPPPAWTPPALSVETHLPPTETTVLRGPAPATIASEPRRVLAFDDEPVNLLVIRELLTPHGFEVFEATDGRDALDLVRRHDPAVVLLDVMMPHKDGYQVCTGLREHLSPAELPILFLSARCRPEDIVHGFATGANDYVPKPFLGEELVARVQAQVRQRDLYQALRENRTLKHELAEAVVEQRQIEATRDRLAGLFHGLDDPLLLVDAEGIVRLANSAMARFTDLEPQALLEHDLGQWLSMDAVLSMGADPIDILVQLPSWSSPMPLRARRLDIGGEPLWVLTPTTDDSSSTTGISRLLVQKLGACQDRIELLGERMAALTEDLRKDLPWAEAQSALAQLAELVAHTPKDEEPLVLAAELMNEALAMWTSQTGKTKADLAEESGLWKVQVDANGWRRPTTLDKYLDPLRIPRLPKWRTIQKTVDFVANLAPQSPEALALQRKAARLQALALVATR
jgi:two-component system sensor histidine kinase ChiS